MVHIHRASWLLPVCRSPIEDGGLAVLAGRIVAADRFSEVRRSFPEAAVLDHPGCVLLPGLINAHTHLELSYLAHLAHLPAPSSFTDWLILLLEERAKSEEESGPLAQRIAQAAQTVLTAQQNQGVAALADISNSGLCFNLAKIFKGRLLCFTEYLGLRADGLVTALRRLHDEPDSRCCTGHSPYSTHPDLLRGLKARANRLGHIFPIHTAESAAEIELLRTGGGDLRTFLEERGVWDGSLQPIEEGGAVSWLRRCGLLDKNTLCVHCVHLSKEEIDLLAYAGAKVCLCPGSNRYLGTGLAPAVLMLNKGILPALGTDSLSSNPELSLWREMRLLAEDHPALAPADLLAMATLGGAAALGFSKALGTLEPGKEAAVLAMNLHAPARTAEGILEQVVQQGGRCPLRWL